MRYLILITGRREFLWPVRKRFFVTIDVARKEDGTLIIMEFGDGFDER